MINNRQQSGRRRGRGGQNRPNGGRGPEGNRIDSRARGNAPQMLEKFKTLARDAQQAGDRVLTEYYLQFADHYFRVVSETRTRYEENQPRRAQGDAGGDDQGYEGEEGYDGEDGDEFDARPQQRQQPQQQQPQQRYQRDDQPQQRYQRDDQNGRDTRPPRDDAYRTQQQPPRERQEYDERPREDRPREERPRVERPRRERFPAPEQANGEARLNADLLPPSFAPPPVTASEDDAPPPPKRRGRPRKDAGVPAVES